MKVPAIHTIEGLQNWACKSDAGSKWVLARPEPYYHWTMRWKAAWLVFTGKADAVKWTGQ